MNSLKDLFLLDKNTTFLNFGSFGATPKYILDRYQELQIKQEANPVKFFAREGLELLKDARISLAKFINCSQEDVVFVTNPSYAINAIAKSLQLKNGDEILSTNLEYGAMERTWNYYCQQKGTKFIQQPISLPIESKESFLEEFWRGFTENTKAIFISQITSTTGLILPVDEICTEAKQRGLLTIVDGAHVPGHIPLDLSKLQADIYTGACHKWMMAPKGCSFLYVNKQNQNWVDPLIISWGYESDFPSDSQFLDYHQMNGTRDYTAFLTIPACIEFMDKYNWTDVAKQSANLTRENGPKFCDLAGSKPLAPLNDEFYGQLFSIPIKTDEPQLLQKILFDKYHIEIPVMLQNHKIYLRYSINGFNTQQDLDNLENAVKELILAKTIIT